MKAQAILLLAASLTAASSGPASAYKPGRPKLITLTELVVRKVIACYPGVEQAESRARGNMSEVYKNRARLRDAALARCGFPNNVVWRNAVYSVRIAAEGSGAGGSVEEAANRAIVAPFRAQVQRILGA